MESLGNIYRKDVAQSFDETEQALTVVVLGDQHLALQGSTQNDDSWGDIPARCATHRLCFSARI
jgi:hypothetical protein